MWDAPQTKEEYLRRTQLVPWIAACGGLVIAIGIAAFQLLWKAPPPPRETDLRLLTAVLFVGFALCGLVWAYFWTARWRLLGERGRFVDFHDVSISPLVKNGAQPIRVKYMVDGREYKLAKDLPVETIDEMTSRPEETGIVYDPLKPSRAEILSPSIFRFFAPRGAE